MRIKYLIMLINLIFIYNQCYTGKKATNTTDCTVDTDEYNYCCMLIDNLNNTNSTTISQFCYNLARDSFIGQKSISYNSNIYTLDCGSAIPGVKQAGTTCGKTNPMSVTDCSSASVITNSCCYFNFGGKSGCYWLNKVYSGPVTYGSLPLDCLGDYYTYSIILTIMYLGLLLN